MVNDKLYVVLSVFSTLVICLHVTEGEAEEEKIVLIIVLKYNTNTACQSENLKVFFLQRGQPGL